VTVFNNNNDEFSCFKIMLPLLQWFLLYGNFN
jgi:hypothetical protein